MDKDNPKKEQLSEAEVARRRDEALKRALEMPPKPHKTAQSDKKQGGDRRQPQKPRAESI